MWASVRDARLGCSSAATSARSPSPCSGPAHAGSPPLNARQLLLVNLLTDLAPSLAIAVREPPASGRRLLRGGPEPLLRSR